MNLKNDTNDPGLVISEDVLAKMVSVAALEVEGVIDIVPEKKWEKFIPAGNKAITVKTGDKSVTVTVCIKVKMGIKIADVCKKVQENVKTSIQNMTNYAVSAVNVRVVDIDTETVQE